MPVFSPESNAIILSLFNCFSELHFSYLDLILDHVDQPEINQLVNLLKKLKDEDLRPPNTPYEVWYELATLFPFPAVEVLVTRDNQDFLLTERHDKYWHGWHLPGGFLLYQESIADACRRISKTEIGVEAGFRSLIYAYVWPDHPYGAPVSLVCVCHSEQEPVKGQFFNELPKLMIPHHDEFIKVFLERK